MNVTVDVVRDTLKELFRYFVTYEDKRDYSERPDEPCDVFTYGRISETDLYLRFISLPTWGEEDPMLHRFYFDVLDERALGVLGILCLGVEIPISTGRIFSGRFELSKLEGKGWLFQTKAEYDLTNDGFQNVIGNHSSDLLQVRWKLDSLMRMLRQHNEFLHEEQLAELLEEVES